MSKQTLQIDLPADAWTRIDRLAAEVPHDGNAVETVVTVLLDIVQRGIELPRSKEREMVIQCFGEEAVQEAILQEPRTTNR